MPTTNGTATEIGGAKFDRSRKFGIEIEAYNCEAETLAHALTVAGIECHEETYNHNNRPHWKIVSDASIRGVHPFELVSPPLKGDEGIRQVETVCRVLKEQGVKVNRSTGLHVHHDAHDLNLDAVKSVLTMWWKYEDVIMYFLPPSRRANMYCAPAMPRVGTDGGTHQGYRWTPGADPVQGWKSALDTVRSIRQLGEGGSFQHCRYAPVNCHAINRHGTLEFRSHAGTTEFAKIQAWIVLTQWFVTRSKDRGCLIRTRMTGRWAEQVMFFWRAINWVNLDDAQVIKAKNTLSRRFKHFKELERGGNEAIPAGPLAVRDAAGRVRPTDYAAMPEPGEQ